jgi:hypothetical protein
MQLTRLKEAHAHCFRNRDEVLASSVCGCFYCCAVFPSAEVEDWTDSQVGEETTALCPNCGIDSIIGDKSGYPMTKAFLLEMKLWWF